MSAFDPLQTYVRGHVLPRATASFLWRVSSRLAHRRQQPIAQCPYLRGIALMLRINQPEAVAVLRDMRKRLHQQSGVDGSLEHRRTEDCEAMPSEGAQAVQHLRFEPESGSR